MGFVGRTARHAPLALALLTASTWGCANLGQYVWADSLPEAPTHAPAEYQLAPGDAIFVRVFNQDGLSGRVRIRPDGRVTLPFVNDVPAAGHSTQDLAKSIQTKLRDFINQPVVTVSLDEPAPMQVSVLGEVVRPGVYPQERGQGLLRALAAAGGLTEFAHRDRIFLVRSTPAGRIRFSLDQLATPGTRSATFRLQPDDVVVVQ
jgi:polysaccharide export outer membrane protein